MKIVITDCDHASVGTEDGVVRAAGGELVTNQAIEPADIIATAQGADGLIVQYGRITAEVLDALPSVKVVSRYGVGVDTVDVAAATARGVAVCNVPDYGTEAVSDHAIALTLAVTRGLGILDRRVRAGAHNLEPAFPIHQIAGSVFGVVGLGAIGAAAARKAAGLGYTVVACDTRLEPGTRTAEGYQVLSLDELLRRSDVVSIHTPLTAETTNLIGPEQLSLLKPTAVLVNTARGGIVDTDALVDALQAGRLHGAGIDVVVPEPIPADHPLTQLDNVILTPHAAFYTEESYTELKRRTAENAVDVVAGRTPRNILNPEVLAIGEAR
jgi:D-3-phosphoglycerate dehydrogenase / 2-oxoglutarate reductase